MSFWSNPLGATKAFFHDPVAALNIPSGPASWLVPASKLAAGAGVGMLTGGVGWLPALGGMLGEGLSPGGLQNSAPNMWNLVGAGLGGYGGDQLGNTFTGAGSTAAGSVAPSAAASGVAPTVGINGATDFTGGAGDLAAMNAAPTAAPSVLGTIGSDLKSAGNVVNAIPGGKMLVGGALTSAFMPHPPTLTPISQASLDAATLPLMQKQMQDQIAQLEGKMAAGGGLSSGELYQLDNLKSQLAQNLAAQGAKNAITATTSGNQTKQANYQNANAHANTVFTGGSLAANPKLLASL